MVKYLFCILFFCFFIKPASSQVIVLGESDTFEETTNKEQLNKSSCKIMNLRGKVSSIKEIDYAVKQEFVASFDQVAPSVTTGSNSFIFDTIGNLVEFYTYNSNGSFRSKETYKYDLKNNRIENNSYSKKDKLTERTSLTYDSIGRLTQLNTYNSRGSLKEQSLSKFSNNGQFELRTTTDEHWLITEKLEIIYNSKGEQTEISKFSSKGKMSAKMNLIYNEFGNVSEKKMYSNKGVINEKFIFKYNNLKELNEYGVFNENETLIAHAAYVFYYDKNNNWIKKVSYFNGAPSAITYRTITYY